MKKALFSAFFVLVSTVACGKPERQPGKQLSCVCTFLTDYDDAARVDVDVCVADGKSIADEAKACASRTAHNHVEGCKCGSPKGPCDAGAKDACDAH